MAPTGEAEAAAREIGLLPGYQRPGARQGAKTGVEPPRNGDNGWGLVNSHGLEMGPERERLGGHGSPARRHQLLAAASALSSGILRSHGTHGCLESLTMMLAISRIFASICASFNAKPVQNTPLPRPDAVTPTSSNVPYVPARSPTHSSCQFMLAENVNTETLGKAAKPVHLHQDTAYEVDNQLIKASRVGKSLEDYLHDNLVVWLEVLGTALAIASSTIARQGRQAQREGSTSTDLQAMFSLEFCRFRGPAQLQTAGPTRHDLVSQRYPQRQFRVYSYGDRAIHDANEATVLNRQAAEAGTRWCWPPVLVAPVFALARRAIHM
ncbi:hypothetical protein E4U15_008019 [Claviceps sp. LM218 group G6]|nr:hypothetical protein E4U15_008019 [Claviceps sp. LM218 group G6]